MAGHAAGAGAGDANESLTQSERYDETERNALMIKEIQPLQASIY